MPSLALVLHQGLAVDRPAADPASNQAHIYYSTDTHDLAQSWDGVWVTVSSATLPSDVAFTDVANTFTQAQTFGDATVTGTLTLDTRLDSDALPTDVAYTDVVNTFTQPQTVQGTVTASGVAATGLTGATAASRYVGATASGAPVSGTFAVGDFAIDRSGAVWVCTAGGSPGTWVGSANLLASARIRTTSDVTATSGSFVTLALNTVEWDTGTASSQVSSGTLVCRKDGIYSVTAMASWSSISPPITAVLSKYILFFIEKNHDSSSMPAISSAATSFIYQPLAATVALHVGDILDAHVFQNTGGSVQVSADMAMTFLRPLP